MVKKGNNQKCSHTEPYSIEMAEHTIFRMILGNHLIAMADNMEGTDGWASSRFQY